MKNIGESKICRLCFSNDPDDFEFVDSNTTDKIGIVLPDLNLSIFGNSILCNKCSLNLSQAFAFKSSCLEIEDNIHNYTNNGQLQVNLEKILGLMDMDDNLDDDENTMRRNMRICRTCLDIVEVGIFTRLDGYENHLINHILQKCLPELDHHLTKDPGICDKCKHLASSTTDFISQCMDLEAKIMDYVKLELPENLSINNAFKYVFHEKEDVLLLNSDVIIITQENEEIFTIEDDSTQNILDCHSTKMNEKQEYNNEMIGVDETNTPDKNLDMREESDNSPNNCQPGDNENTRKQKCNSTNSISTSEATKQLKNTPQIIGVDETNTPDKNSDMREESDNSPNNCQPGDNENTKKRKYNSTNSISTSEATKQVKNTPQIIGDNETNTPDENLDMREECDNSPNNCQPRDNENTRKRKYNSTNSISTLEATKQVNNTPQIIISDDEDSPIINRRHNPKRSSRITTRIIDSDDDVSNDPDFRPDSYHNSESDDPDYETRDQTPTFNSTQKSKQRKILSKYKNKTEKRRKKEESTKKIVHNNNSYLVVHNSNPNGGQPLYHIVLAPEMTRLANNQVLIAPDGSSLHGTLLFSSAETIPSTSTSVRVPTGFPLVVPQTLPMTGFQQITPIVSMPQYSSVQPGNIAPDVPSSRILSFPGTNSGTVGAFPGNMTISQTSVTAFQQTSLFSYNQGGSFVAGPSNLQAYAPNMLSITKNAHPTILTSGPMAPVQATSSISENMQATVVNNNNNALLAQQISSVHGVTHSTSSNNGIRTPKQGLPIQETPVITGVNPASLIDIAQSTLATGRQQTPSYSKTCSTLIFRNAPFGINRATSNTKVKSRTLTSTARLSRNSSIKKVNPVSLVTRINPVTSITKVNPAKSIIDVTTTTSITKVNPAKSITEVNKTASITKVNPVTPFTEVITTTSITKVKPVTPITEVDPVTSIIEVDPVTPITEADQAKSITKVNPVTPITEVDPLTSITKVNPVTPITEVVPVTSIIEVDPATPITEVNQAKSITEVNSTTSIIEVDLVTPITEVNSTASITKVDPVTPITEVDPVTSIIGVDPATPITEANQVKSITEVDSTTSITEVNPVTPITEVNPATSINYLDQAKSMTAANPVTSITEIESATTITEVDQAKTIAGVDLATPISEINSATSITEVDQETPITGDQSVTKIVSETSAQYCSIGGESVEQRSSVNENIQATSTELTHSMSPVTDILPVIGNESVEVSSTVDNLSVTPHQNTLVTEINQLPSITGNESEDLRTSEQHLSINAGTNSNSVTGNSTVSSTLSGTATQSIPTEGINNTTTVPNSSLSLFMYLTASNTGKVDGAVKSTVPNLQQANNGNLSAQGNPALGIIYQKPKNRPVVSASANKTLNLLPVRTSGPAKSGPAKSKKEKYNAYSKANAVRYKLGNRSKHTIFFECINCGFKETNIQLYKEHMKKCRKSSHRRNEPTETVTIDLDPDPGHSDERSEKSDDPSKNVQGAGSEVVADSSEDKSYPQDRNRLAPNSKLQPEQKGLAVLKCDLCSFNARTYSRIEKHIREHISDLGKNNIYQCDVCEDCFTSIDNISNHLKYTHNLDYYKLYYWCVKCATIFNKPLELNAHFPRCLFKDKVVRLFKSNDIIFCLLCEFETDDVVAARSHLKSCRITNVVVSDEVIEID